MWSRDGREIFYSRWGEGKQHLYTVPVSTTPTFHPGKPSLLLEEEGPVWIMDVSADGQKFLMLEPETRPTELRVVLNWFSELERLVPTR
jgi:hypothetical protein